MLDCWPFSCRHARFQPCSDPSPVVPACCCSLLRVSYRSVLNFKEDTSSLTQKLALSFVKEDTSSVKVASFRHFLRAYKEGGSRGHAVTVGRGQSVLPYTSTPNPNAIARRPAPVFYTSFTLSLTAAAAQAGLNPVAFLKPSLNRLKASSRREHLFVLFRKRQAFPRPRLPNDRRGLKNSIIYLRMVNGIGIMKTLCTVNK